MPSTGSEGNHRLDGVTVYGGLALNTPSAAAANAVFLNADGAGGLLVGTQTATSAPIVTLQDPLDGTVTPARSSIPRTFAEDDGAVLTTQVMTSVPVYLAAGDVVTKICFISGATAAGTPTNYWFALYSSAATPALLSQTADQTSTAWAANTVKDLALGAPQVITASGTYWAAVMVKATTPPSLWGRKVGNAVLAAPVVTGQVNHAQTSGAALTTTAPATIATPTAIVDRAYALCH